MTTWRFESMCTRTLSTTISTSRPRPRLSHRTQRLAVASPAPQDQADDDPQGGPADVGEERHAALRRLRPELPEAVDELQHEPEAQDQQGRDVDELGEEAEEDERHDASAWIEHEVGAERRGDRAGGADEGSRRGRVDGQL